VVGDSDIIWHEYKLVTVQPTNTFRIIKKKKNSEAKKSKKKSS